LSGTTDRAETIMPELADSLDERLMPWPLGDERRASVRRPAAVRATCRLLSGDGPPCQVGARDVSAFGAGLLLSSPVPLSALLRIDFEGGAVRTLLGRVVHVTAGRGNWLVGCAFVRELEGPALKPFHAERVRSPAGDSRRWVRFPSNVEAPCYSLDTTPGESSRARVLDVSAGGLGLLLPCEFGAGTLLTLDLSQCAGEPVLLRVARAVARPNREWFLGCEFADQLTPDEMDLLLRSGR
jgi:hypothetical protein